MRVTDYLLSIGAYLIQILIFVLIAGIVPMIVYIAKKKRKVALLLFVVMLLLEGIGVARLCKKPLWHCPKQFEAYVSDSDKERILGFNSGFFSPRIPVFPVAVTVEDADEEHIVVRTIYLFFGSSVMDINEDGPSSTGLFGN